MILEIGDAISGVGVIYKNTIRHIGVRHHVLVIVGETRLKLLRVIQFHIHSISALQILLTLSAHSQIGQSNHVIVSEPQNK